MVQHYHYFVLAHYCSIAFKLSSTNWLNPRSLLHYFPFPSYTLSCLHFRSYPFPPNHSLFLLPSLTLPTALSHLPLLVFPFSRSLFPLLCLLTMLIAANCTILLTLPPLHSVLIVCLAVLLHLIATDIPSWVNFTCMPGC